MQIYVNEQVLDAKLSGEKNIAEVYDAVKSWSHENKKYILGLRVDSQEVVMSALGNISTDGVNRLDFYIGDEMDMVQTTVEELDRYLDQIGSTLFELENLSDLEVSNLKDGMHWIDQIMNSISSILRMDLHLSVLASDEFRSEPIDEILKRMRQAVDKFSALSDRESIESFLEDLRNFKAFVMKLSLQLRMVGADPGDLTGILVEFNENIPSLAEQIVSINANLNAGRDRIALEILEKTTDRLNRYITALFAFDFHLSRAGDKTLADITINGESFLACASSLTDLLRNLSTAMEDNDMVAAGDILEYELTEKLRAMRPYLTEIGQLMVARK